VVGGDGRDIAAEYSDGVARNKSPTITLWVDSNDNRTEVIKDDSGVTVDVASDR